MRLNAYLSQNIAKFVLWTLTLFTIFILVFIIFFILWKGLPVVSLSFILDSPKYLGREGGIFPTIIGTIFLVFISVFVSTPIGVGTAIYLTEYTYESRITRIIRFGVECLAGIPSIIFGLFGFIFFVVYLKLGWSILSGGLTLSFMILPTIVRTSEEAIKSVPQLYREVSFSLGASKWQTVSRVVLPSALPGIFTGIILGIGRSIGETAAVIFTAGSSLRVPTSVLSPVRTMAVHFYILAREGISMENAFGTAAILIITILIINVIANLILYKLISKE